jgi:hypothetical protein
MPPFGPLCRWDTWIPHFVLDQLTDAGRQGLKSRRLHLGHNPRARGPVWWRTRPRREHRRPHGAPGHHTSPSADKVAVDQRVPGRGHIRQIHRHSGVFDPAGGASVLALHPHGGGSLLDMTGLINDQTASGSVVADLRGYVSERLAPSASHLARASRCCSRSGLG